MANWKLAAETDEIRVFYSHSASVWMERSGVNKGKWFYSLQDGRIYGPCSTKEQAQQRAEAGVKSRVKK